MRIVATLALAVLMTGFAPPARAASDAVLLVEQRGRPASARQRDNDPIYTPVVWTASPDGARATAQFEFPNLMKGSMEFYAVPTPGGSGRALTIRLEPLDPALGAVAEVYPPSVDGMGVFPGPRLNGRVSRRDATTFDMSLDADKADENSNAIGLGEGFYIPFRLDDGRLGSITVERSDAHLQALALLFPPIAVEDRKRGELLEQLAEESAEADAAKLLFGGASAGNTCFARHYDAEHLRRHPLQRTVDFGLIVRKRGRYDDDWSFAASAVLIDGLPAGLDDGEIKRIWRSLLRDDLHETYLFSAQDGGVEDGQTGFSLSLDGRHAVFSPLDEMGVGDPSVMWPAAADPRPRYKETSSEELFDHHDNDDQSFRLDRAELSVCEDIARRARIAGGGARKQE